MSPSRWTYALGALALASLAGMYVTSFVIGAEPFPLALVVLASTLAIIGAVVGLRTFAPVPRPRVRDAAAAAAAAAVALLFTRDMGMPALVSVSLVAVTIGMMAVPSGPFDRRSQGSAYVGAFVGLIAPSITLPSVWVVVSGAVGGLLWSMIATSAFEGLGGRLGLVALMASAAVYWLASALGYEGSPVLLPEVRGLAHMAMIPIGAAGAIVTWMLIHRRGWDFAMASGLTSLMVCGVIALSSMGALAPVLATAWFGGTMVGLSTPERLPNAAWVIVAGMIYGAYMLHFEGPLQGHVGVIGATGTIAVLVTVGVIWVGARAAELVARRRDAAAARVPA